MSFLGPETDDESESTLLQDVLGFIDAYEETAVAPSDKRRPNASDTRRARSQSYRIRDEMQNLRREAEQLETRIVELKNGTDRNYELQLVMLRMLNTNAHHSKRWIESVLHEYCRRQESERMNRQLKALLAKQLRVIQASETAFGVFTNTEISLIFNSQRTMMLQNRAMDEVQVMTSLGDRMDKLELIVDNVVDGIDTGSMTLLRHIESRPGVSFESSSCTMLPCSVEQADTLLIQQYHRKATKHCKKKSEFNIRDIRMTKLKHFQHEQQSYELVGTGRMRKMDHPDHVVFVRSSLISLPSEHLSFIEESIVVICRPSQDKLAHPTSDCSTRAIMINWHCAHAQQNDSPLTIEQKRSAMGTLMQKFIGASSDRDRHHMQKIKIWLREGRQGAT